ncbi:MarR family winged helix-turn-helix transcriptional regulator [Parasporobacterium paucivorans]|uniref:DNA-binding transcriptional regulator, MarR family n=1 Tax=Parasporobacterium paucivorans DSM 15970 TaxID=1122934 RepID=A0A1M6IQ75_9FIRM|nr:MarR family transcriptional regulator [Parasporobacterium paucivorans]SHJ36577.1 DNA-binding transcriptional regulator, MarR family [Parasporobacterium paucivorans DSM 15970]
MLMNNLSIIIRHCRTFCERKLRELDIGFSEQVILMYLSENKNVSQDDIVKHFMIDKGAIAKSLSKLEAKDYIIRNENPLDKREKLILLSSKSEQIFDYMKLILEEWNQYFFRGLSSEEIEQFVRILGTMADNVSQIPE